MLKTPNCLVITSKYARISVNTQKRIETLRNTEHCARGGTLLRGRGVLRRRGLALLLEARASASLLDLRSPAFSRSENVVKQKTLSEIALISTTQSV